MRGELDWIVMKALEKDRNRRYETANGLAADVQRYLDDEPVQACPPSAGYRFRKFARRNTAGGGRRRRSSALAVLLAVAGLAASTVLIARGQLQARRPRPRTTCARRSSASGATRTSTGSPWPTASCPRTTWAGALELLDECPEDLREWEWHYLMRLCRVEPVVLRDKTEVNSVAFSPDGERLASAGGDGTVKIWNSRTGKVIQTFPAHTPIRSSASRSTPTASTWPPSARTGR